MAKRYEATQETLTDASYEVRLEGSTIDIKNITGIDQGTLYAKKGNVSVTIEGTPRSLAISDDITSIEDAANAIKSILYVLNGASDHTNEAITGAQNIAGDPAPADLTFGQLTAIN
jgi:hypothetical protein